MLWNSWNKWTLGVLTLSIYCASLSAGFAATSGLNSGNEIETTCRVKAKEIAADSYRSCVTENKTAQIEKIKAEYQEKIKALKADYEAQIQKMGGKIAAKKESKSEGKGIQNLKSEEGTKVEENKKDESTMDIPEPVPVEKI